MSVSRNLGHKNFWRILAAVTFLNQVIRVPLLLSLAHTAKDLEAYFIIATTSIPVQFIAQDILQYRSGSHHQSLVERLGIPLFACGSIAYVTWHHGLLIGCSYLLFALALLFYGASLGKLRQTSSPERVLAADAVYNTGFTLIAAVFVLCMSSSAKLGHAVILSQAVAATLVGLFNRFSNQQHRLGYNASKTPVTIPPQTPNSASTATPLVLIGIMATTQLERLVIAASQPAVLVCISLAAGVTQAWRKVGMDDALVFDRLQKHRNNNIYDAISKEIRHARIIFYPPLVLALIAGIFINQIAPWLSSHGIFRSLDHASYVTAAAILYIYLGVMPASIVMINTLRQRVIPMQRLGWWALGIVGFIEIIALIFPYALGHDFNISMAIIPLTASLNISLLLALCPVRLLEAARLLFFDIVVFLIIVALIWILAL